MTFAQKDFKDLTKLDVGFFFPKKKFFAIAHLKKIRVLCEFFDQSCNSYDPEIQFLG
jgi:hypothetical protein